MVLLALGACGDDEGMEIIVDPDNIAPVLTDPGNLVLATIDEDTSTPAGDTVADILNGPTDSEGPITDEDADDPQGIAVIAVDNSNGAWEYDPDGEGTASFTPFGAISGASAVVLAPTALIRFVPDQDFNGSGGAVTFRAWDQSAGLSSGTRANIDSVGTGDPTPFSASTAMATVAVNAVNDAPRNTGSAPPAITATEGVAADVDLSNLTVSDVDLDDSGTPPNDITVTLTATEGGTLSAAAGSTGVGVAGSGSSTLTVTGALTEVNSFFDDMGGADLEFTLGAGDSHDSIRITANDGGLSGSGGEGMATLAIVSVNQTTGGTPGTLTFVDYYQNMEAFIELAGATSIAFSPEGDYVYVGAKVSQAINVFSRNPATSELMLIDTFKNFQASNLNLSSVVLSPNGNHLYFASPNRGVLHHLNRSAATGMLTPGTFYEDDVTVGVDDLKGASNVVLSPDGKFVYVSASQDLAISVFSRDATTGALTIVAGATQTQGMAGVDGIAKVEDLAISPDGTSLYAAEFVADKIAVFSRNTTSGTLTFLEVHEDDVDDVDGLAGVQALAISPDSNYVYAASRRDHAIAIFSRATDGTLTYQEMVKDGQGNVVDLAGAFSVAISPDGQHLYATGSDDNALLTFDRNPDTGNLTFVESHIDNVPPVDGLAGAGAVAVSPDGQSVYATSLHISDVAVAAFHRETGR